MDRVRRKKVEVLYFRDCPNHRQAVELARKVVSEIGVDAEIEEVEVRTREDAAGLRFLGSPSVRVDGVDIEPGARNSTAYGLACRVYGRDVVPSREMLVAALREERGGTPVRSDGPRSWRAALTAFPGVGALLLPVAKCPACWPAYAGFLSSAGLGGTPCRRARPAASLSIDARSGLVTPIRHMKRGGQAFIRAALGVMALLSRTAPSEAGGLHELAGLDELRERFNEGRGAIRVVLLLSPT